MDGAEFVDVFLLVVFLVDPRAITDVFARPELRPVLDVALLIHNDRR